MVLEPCWRGKIASGIAMEAQCKQVTRIEKYVGKGLNDYDTTLFARVDEIFNELEV